VDDLLKRPEPALVLAWPGALARYGLSGALARIVNEAERGDAPAVLLVVPSHADGTAPSINGRLPVPGRTAASRAQVGQQPVDPFVQQLVGQLEGGV
jgi:hypothetical protein